PAPRGDLSEPSRYVVHWFPLGVCWRLGHVIRSLLRLVSQLAELARRRADHGYDRCQRELRDVIDVADHIRPGGLEQAQAPVFCRCVDALYVADLPALLNLPAY